MRKNLIWLLCGAALLAVLIAAVPSGHISAQGCVDENGRPADCPKKRPTVIYPSFTPTLTLTPMPTSTKVPSLTPTKVPAFTATKVPSLTPSKVPASSNQGRPDGSPLLWIGGFFGVVLVGIIIYLYQGAGSESSSFDAKAHGDLNEEDEFGTVELTGEVNGDDSVEGSAGIYDGPEDE